MAMAVAAERTGALLSDLRRIFGDRLRSLVVYGEQQESRPVTCLVLVASLDAADLDACAHAADAWHRKGLATPLIMPESEFRRSVDAFPLEYSEMSRTHGRVYGGDPFAGIAIPADDLRRACETQIKSHLLHLREEYIETGGRPQAIAALVHASAPAFASLLRSVAWLQGSTAADRATATLDGARAAEVPEDVVAAVLALEPEGDAGIASADPARLFPQYVAAVERLSAFVDRWRAS